MRIRTTFALAAAVLTIGVPAAAADPDGPYQPQIQAVAQPDALDRYLSNNTPEAQPDAIDRYLQNRTSAFTAVETTGAAGHPDSLAVRPGPTTEPTVVATDGRDWTPGVVGALGGALFAFLAIVGASAIRERRRLILR